MPRIVIRPASRDDIARLAIIEGRPAPTLKAMVAEADGEPVALGGLARVDGRYIAFCDLSSAEAASCKIAVMRAAKRMLRDAKRHGIKFIYAQLDDREPRARAWLESLGFRLDPRSQLLYRWSAAEWHF